MSAHGREQLFEFVAEDHVVVIAPGVTRNPAARLPACSLSRSFGRNGIGCVVVESADNDASSVCKHPRNARATRIMQVLHETAVAALEPLPQMPGIGQCVH